MRCSRLSTTSSPKSTPPTAATTARMSSCTGLPSHTAQVAAGSPMRRASCRVSTVSSPASPGATSLGPPEKPAKKCGSTKPVVMRTSASTHSRLRNTGTPSPCTPRSTSEESSRASWLTTRTRPTTSSPSMARISASVLPRWVPVATSSTTSSSATMPSSSSSTAGTIRCRGWGRVPSHIEMATRCPGRTSSRSGGPATGERSASRSTCRWSSGAGAYVGSTTVVRSRGRSTTSPSSPYARRTPTVGSPMTTTSVPRARRPQMTPSLLAS